MHKFTGFQSDAFEFLHDLAGDNTKSFFDANRSRYEQFVAGPTRAFVDAMTPALQATVHADLDGEPKVGRSLFRINRDVRFGKDKTPYNAHVDIMWWVGDGPVLRALPAVICRLTSTTVLLGAGQFGLRNADLARYRDRLISPEFGPRFRAAVDAASVAGCSMTDATRAHPPRGFPVDHMNADLSLRDGFHLYRTVAHPSEVAGHAFVGWCEQQAAVYRDILAVYTA
jgi:uncharacterized protein (TIGR02453 family)